MAGVPSSIALRTVLIMAMPPPTTTQTTGTAAASADEDDQNYIKVNECMCYH